MNYKSLKTWKLQRSKVKAKKYILEITTDGPRMKTNELIPRALLPFVSHLLWDFVVYDLTGPFQRNQILHSLWSQYLYQILFIICIKF